MKKYKIVKDYGPATIPDVLKNVETIEEAKKVAYDYSYMGGCSIFENGVFIMDYSNGVRYNKRGK